MRYAAPTTRPHYALYWFCLYICDVRVCNSKSRKKLAFGTQGPHGDWPCGGQKDKITKSQCSGHTILKIELDGNIVPQNAEY